MLLFFCNSDIIPGGVNCLKKIVWDWNGTLLDDVDLCFSCINRLLVNHDLKPLMKCAVLTLKNLIQKDEAENH